MPLKGQFVSLRCRRDRSGLDAIRLGAVFHLLAPSHSIGKTSFWFALAVHCHSGHDAVI